MKKNALSVLVFVSLGLLTGCAAQLQASKRDSIPFTEGQFYAAAYLGYQQMEDLDYYVEQYLDSDQVPIHYLSDGDYYLVIPRYAVVRLTYGDETVEFSPFISLKDGSVDIGDQGLDLTRNTEMQQTKP